MSELAMLMDAYVELKAENERIKKTLARVQYNAGKNLKSSICWMEKYEALQAEALKVAEALEAVLTDYFSAESSADEALINWKEYLEPVDPTPYCNCCDAKTANQCNCPPRAKND